MNSDFFLQTKQFDVLVPTSTTAGPVYPKRVFLCVASWRHDLNNLEALPPKKTQRALPCFLKRFHTSEKHMKTSK